MRRGRLLVVWLLIVVAESIHGTIRELYISPVLGDLPARQLGVLVGSAIVFVIAVLAIRWIGARTVRAQLTVGAVWVALTVAFEVAIGLALGYPAERLLGDYDLAAGGYMGFGLLLVLLSPVLADRARSMRIRAAVALGAVFVLVVVAVLVRLTYQRDVRAAYERITGRSLVADTPCGPIEYAVAGDGPPVLVVHGSGGGFDQGLLFLEPLVRRDFSIIAVSRFGYLRTPLPEDATAEAQADAHACLLDALGISRAAVLGASAGAPSAMQIAIRHPERITALVLLVPAAYVPRSDGAPPLVTPSGTPFLFDTALRSDFLFWAAPRIARGMVLRSILATPPEVVSAASESERARVDAIIEQILPVRPRRPGLLNDASVTSTLSRYALESITAPTLTLGLEDDLFGTHDGARYTALHIPNARFVSFPSGGHVWVGREDEVMGAIVDFLEGHP